MSSASSFSLHLLDVTIRPSGYVNDVIQGSWLNLKEGVSNDGKGRRVHGFKVTLFFKITPIRLHSIPP